MDSLVQLSDSLAAAAAAAADGTVRVEARRRIPSTGILWGKNGLIVTANHTVHPKTEIRVGLPGGETADASLVGRDPTTDVAVLRLAKAGGKTLPTADPDKIKVGHLVLAVGRPGDSHQATLGIVSALDGAWRTPLGGSLERFLQTDVVMAPGFSGGPLVNAHGALLGLNTSGLLRGMALAIPASSLTRIVDALATHGRIRTGYLGVGIQPARLSPSAGEAAGQERGLLVASVEPGGPADVGGILLGDVILALGGGPIQSMEDLLAALSGDVVGKDEKVGLLRGGVRKDVDVRIGERAAPVEEE